MTNNTHKTTWETYTQSWSETEPSKRLALFKQALSPDCIYTDPLMQTTGYEQLSGYMTALHHNVPSVSFIITDFKSHHDRSLAHWNMLDGEGNVLSQGSKLWPVWG